MGLDNFWKGGTPVNFSPDINLCGGMFSQHGEGSFRGKVYAHIIERATDGKHSLYTETISNEDVQDIAVALENSKYSNLIAEASTFHVSEQEFEDLKWMFRVYADAGATLHGWW